ncbi:MAG: YebC/PmpR family DNA-binding transcriptional regulator [Phycisphaerales bacterium]|nr:YebC/PmpR family DNA-binding transcriptional regulator [Phycisphaerales bacterium]
MAGHSHWARIKRAKAVTDARRGRAWSKLARAVIVAARIGGGDPDANLALRYAIDAARDGNMPRDTIERAIKKGTGELGAEQYEEVVYEGYGPGGAAVMALALTDNRHRTAPEIKKIFEMNGGNIAVPNAVGWNFARRGVFRVPTAAADEERMMEIALALGADDVSQDGDEWELRCDPALFEAGRKAIADAGLKPSSSQIALIPGSTVQLEGERAAQMVALVEALEEHDDVQNVYSNFEISEQDMQALAGE